MGKLLMLIILLPTVQGCGALMSRNLPTIVPTGNPITDVLVSAAIQEGARIVAEQTVSVILGTVAMANPFRGQRVIYGRRAIKRYVGW